MPKHSPEESHAKTLMDEAVALRKQGEKEGSADQSSTCLSETA